MTGAVTAGAVAAPPMFVCLSTELEAHFDYEEEQLVAVLNAISPADLR